LQFWLRFCRIGPQQAADAVGRLAGEECSRVGVDAGGGHLGVSQDFLYDVDVDVQFAQERPGCVPGVVQPGVLGDARISEECFPLVPVVVRVDRPSVWLAPDQVPVLPVLPGRFLLGVLVLEVLAAGQENWRPLL